MNKEPNYYRILGVAPLAGQEEIKQAYHKLAKLYHPDAMPPDKRAWAQNHMARINQAYQVLCDEQKRARYDYDRGYARSIQPYSRSAPSGLSTAPPNIDNRHPHWQRSRAREHQRRLAAQRWRTISTASASLLVLGLLSLAFLQPPLRTVGIVVDGVLAILAVGGLVMVNRL